MERVKRVLALVALLVFWAGCGQPAAPGQSLPAGKETASAPAVLPMEAVALEDGETYALTAGLAAKEVAGKKEALYTYNGRFPGPLLRVKQGSRAAIEFANQLPEETTIHWHGIRVQNAFDGVPDVTQAAVKPRERFRYELVFPDDGIYWYHPHAREDKQQELGLYGGILVEPMDDEYYNDVDLEEVLFLDDVLVEANGIKAFSDDVATDALMGRFGNVMLVNGEEDYRLNVRQGETVRLYLVNAANTRTFNFGVQGHRLKLVGGDSGKFEREEWVDAVTIAPSERYIVEVAFDQAGVFTLQSVTPRGTRKLGEVIVGQGNAARVGGELTANADVAASLERFRPLLGKVPDWEVELTLEMMPMMGGGSMASGMEGMGHGGMAMPMQGMEHAPTQSTPMAAEAGDGMPMEGGTAHGTPMRGEESVEPIEWEADADPMMAGMNEMATSETTRWIIRDKATGKENMDVAFTAKVGDVKKIRIHNLADSMHPMQHPMHLHGQRFLVAAVDGKPNENLVWKDTVLVPAGSYVDVLVDFSNSGKWMLHCHIPEHLSSGMMALVEVAG